MTMIVTIDTYVGSDHYVTGPSVRVTVTTDGTTYVSNSGGTVEIGLDRNFLVGQMLVPMVGGADASTAARENHQVVGRRSCMLPS